MLQPSQMVGDTRQGWPILPYGPSIFIVLLGVTVMGRQTGKPRHCRPGCGIKQSNINPGGNMERQGYAASAVANCVFGLTATTAASKCSVNSMHDSNMPLGGMIPLVAKSPG